MKFFKENWPYIVAPLVIVVILLVVLMMTSEDGAPPFIYNIF